MVGFLVGECQAEVNARDSQGARPMHYAAEGNKVEALDALLRNGAKVTMAVSVAPRHGLFPPPWIFISGHPFLLHASDPRRTGLTTRRDTTAGRSGRAADALGVRARLARRVRIPPPRGYLPHDPDEDRLDPLHVAALNGRAELLDALIRRIRKTRGDTETRDALNAPLPTNGRTALHLAATNAKLGAIETLANAGADPEARDSHGLRPADTTLNAGVRSLLGARTVGGGVGGWGCEGGGDGHRRDRRGQVQKGRRRRRRRRRRSYGGRSYRRRRTTRVRSGPTPPPPGAPRSGAPRPPAGSLVASSSSVVSSVAEGIGALKVEDGCRFPGAGEGRAATEPGAVEGSPGRTRGR